MLFFYIDESGTGLKDRNSNYFVLGCVVVNANDWPVIDSEVNTIKRRLVSWAKPEDWEIKGRDIRRGEKFFKPLNWEQRITCFREIGELIAELPCRLLAVRVDKSSLTEYIDGDGLYRLAFWRLLEEINGMLEKLQETGMILIDMRSDLHSSVQDRRLLDAYQDWLASKHGRSRIIESPWFGFSAFYAGLQIADFVSYLVDFAFNEEQRVPRGSQIRTIFDLFSNKLNLIEIP